MPPLPALLRHAALRLRAIVFRRALDDDMHAEMREHLERATERYVARGMSPDDARLAARREFGNVAVLQEEARDARGARWVEALIGDLRFAVRYFARHKATTTIIIAVLALATGADALIFSTFQAQFLRPAPAVPRDPSHVRIWARQRATRTAPWEQRGFSRPELVSLAAQRDVFREVAAWTEDDASLDAADSTGARAVGVQFVTTNFFRVLGVPLTAGQGLRQDTANAPDMTAVMAYKMAEQLYGNASSAIGRRITVNEVPVFVVGVAPPRFQGAMRNMHEPALWMPLGARVGIARVSPRWLSDDAALSVFARLAPGTSRTQATAFASHVVTASLPDSAARTGMTRTANVLAMTAPSPGGDPAELLAFTMILCIGALILLVGCMNVSSLMVAAAVGRRHEIAVRLSLGASRNRLLRQLITESTLLALIGSTVGLLLAWWKLTWLEKTEIDGVNMAPDVTTFVFVLVLAIATGVLFGLSPAMHATRERLSNALRDSGAGSSNRSRLQRGFVIAQIALSQPLLVLLATMLALVIGEYRPLSPEMSGRVIAVQFRPLTNGAPNQRVGIVDSLVPRIAERAEVVSAVPEPTGFAIRGVIATDRRAAGTQADTAPRIIHLEGTAPGWFALVDVPVMLGRDVSLADTNAANRPIVIGSDLARQLWGEANPIGRVLASPPLQGMQQDSMAMTVVGVYDATHRLPGMTWNGGAAGGDTPVRAYTAFGKHWQHDRVLVRTRGPALAYVPELRRLLRVRAPSVPVTSMLTLAQMDEHHYQDMLEVVTLAGAGGALALLLASLGLYGVIALAVRQRTREIGIRVALGAHPMRVARMFLASGVRASVIALGLGLPLSIAALKIGMAQGLVIAPNVNPYLIGIVIAGVLLGVASIATWLPARRAARVDPARTLRVE